MAVSDIHPPIGGRKATGLKSARFGGDSFEDGNYTAGPAWTVVTTGGTVVVSTLAARFGKYGMRHTTQGDNDGEAMYHMVSGLDESETNAWTFIRASNAEGIAGIAILDDVPAQIAALLISGDKFVYNVNGADVAFTETPSDNTWYRLRISYNTTTASFYVYEADGTSIIESHEGIVPTVTNNTDEIWCYTLDDLAASFTTDWDNCSFRNTPEP